jgi:hypothetical protein
MRAELFQRRYEAITYANKAGSRRQFTSILYAGISAEKSDKRDEAAIYYKTIVDSLFAIGGNMMKFINGWQTIRAKVIRQMKPNVLPLVNRNFPTISMQRYNWMSCARPDQRIPSLLCMTK